MRWTLSFIFILTWLQPAAFAKTRQMSKEQKIDHALSRLTWGAQPGDVERVHKLGLKKWLDLQLHPGKIAENPELERRLGSLQALKLDTSALMDDFRNRKRESIRPVVRQVQEARVYRAVYTSRQLEDVLTDFWFNHFNVFLDKGADRVFVGAYERDAIRPHVLGRFRDLLEATATHPAMLWYLDNWQSVGQNSASSRNPRRRARGLNENYGRELLELHTMGVDGGYTQKDVIEVARCFTGWTIRDGKFEFVPAMHDRGEKTVLGVTIPAGGGREDGEKVLDILARQPATAKFISRKLAQRFVADAPPEGLVDAMAKTFLQTGGDLIAAMKAMLGSKEFWSMDVYRAKLKSPFELVVSAVRAGRADLRNGFGLAMATARLGQPLYRKQEPTGYSNSSDEWKNSASLLARMNLASVLAKNQLPGVEIQWPQDPVTLIAGTPSDALRESLGKSADPVSAVELVLGSPDFQRR